MSKLLKNLVRSVSLFAAAVVMVAGFIGVRTTAAQAKFSIRISAENVIENELIELGKIADIAGEQARIERLRHISLGYAPNIGMTRELNRRQIMLAVNAAGFTENEFTLVSPEKILIRRLGQNISETQIREAVEQTILSQFTVDRVTARIVNLELPQVIQVPVGAVEIKISLSGVRNMFARFPLGVEIRVNNQTVRRVSATIEIEAFAEIYVAARDLLANTKLSPADVRLEKRRIEKPITNYVRDINRIRGAILIGAASGGQEITSDAVVAGVVIKLGDEVRVEAASGKIKIVINGEARANGKIGDRIAVKNVKSGAILQAVVIDEGLVRVLF